MRTIKTNFATVSTTFLTVAMTGLLVTQIASGLVAPIL